MPPTAMERAKLCHGKRHCWQRKMLVGYNQCSTLRPTETLVTCMQKTNTQPVLDCSQCRLLRTSHRTTRKIKYTYTYIQLLVHYARHNINGMQLITYTRAQQLKTRNTSITNTHLNQCLHTTHRHTFSVMTVMLSCRQKLRPHNPHNGPLYSNIGRLSLDGWCYNCTQKAPG